MRALQEERPGVGTEALEVLADGLNNPRIAEASDNRPDIRPHYPNVDRVLVAVVQIASGSYRRRVFLSLSAAEKAVKKAHDAGRNAEVIVCELRPAGGAFL